MSCYWYPGAFEIAVDNPGHGELELRRLDDASDWVTLTGAELGEVLAAVTARAFGGDWTLRKVGRVDVDEARELLPGLQRAVVLATAGTDRFERTFPDPDESPAEPLCVNCNLGSPYHREVTISERCNEDGHQPFGHRASATWEQAGRRHARDLDWWQHTRRRLDQPQRPQRRELS